MSQTDQLFYHAVKDIEEKRRVEEIKSIIKAVAKIMGVKVR